MARIDAEADLEIGELGRVLLHTGNSSKRLPSAAPEPAVFSSSSFNPRVLSPCAASPRDLQNV